MKETVKFLRLVNDSQVGNNARLLAGDSLIPFYEATVTVKFGELNTITLTAPLEALDVVAGKHKVKIKSTKEDEFKRDRKAYYMGRPEVDIEHIDDIINQEWIDYCDQLEDLGTRSM